MHAGHDIYELVTELFPLNRSITGNGVRDTLALLARDVPLTVHEIPSGTPVLDWVVPPEWNLHDAWIARADGTRVVDAATNNLHVVGYSEPIHRWMPLSELREHIHTLPAHPAWIPYRTSYYTRAWGFCMAAETLARLEEGNYEVCVDATFDEHGSLTYGELVLPGALEDEIVISTHSCHPSLANDNCTGLAMAARLARRSEHATAGTRSASSSFPERSARSRGWLSTKRKRSASCTGSSSPVSAIAAG